MRTVSALLGCLGLAAALVLAPTDAAAQGISIAPKVGSGGLGADLALALNDRLAVRGGVGFIPIEFEDIDLDGNDFDLTTPDFFATAGLDLKVAGPLRLIGGLLFRSGDFEYSATITETVTIGDEEFDDDGTLFGRWENSSTAPFVGIGLGHVAGGSFGIFLDAGVAFTGDPTVTLDVSGGLDRPEVRAELEKERQRIQDDIPEYAKYWPFIQIGFKIGFGN